MIKTIGEKLRDMVKKTVRAKSNKPMTRKQIATKRKVLAKTASKKVSKKKSKKRKTAG